MTNNNLKIFSLMMDVGEAMIECGADVHTVEDTLTKLGFAYGATRMNVFVITEEIVATSVFPGLDEVTMSRRILADGSSNFAKLEALSNLCSEACASHLSFTELQARYNKIQHIKMSNFALFAGGILSAGGFSVFFGGSIFDAFLAAIFAAVICVAIKYFKPIAPNVIIFNFVTSFIVGILICFSASMVNLFNINLVIIGVIMLLIPGVAMTNATRDLLTGDTVSGVIRFIESLLWALALVFGFMLALWVANQVGLQPRAISNEFRAPFIVTLLAATISCLGFSLFFNGRRKHILVATCGGVITWLVYYALFAQSGSIFVSVVVASTFAAIYSEALSYKLKVPSSVFFIIGVITLIPGRLLYYTMHTAVNKAWVDCFTYANQTILFVAGIAVGIFLVASFVQIHAGAKAQILRRIRDDAQL